VKIAGLHFRPANKRDAEQKLLLHQASSPIGSYVTRKHLPNDACMRERKNMIDCAVMRRLMSLCVSYLADCLGVNSLSCGDG